ncbi:DUF2783 domain-containing protein [Ferrovibrio sp.]|uniref:DUF2783 domain-containing protein n=1 Tax=Ferrovibrio sp. TaxID=1917215 RepID=UPI003459607C
MMMAQLNTEPNLKDPDGFYEKLIRMTAGLEDRQARLATAKLALLLANHIGDDAVLDEAMRLARGAAE